MEVQEVEQRTDLVPQRPNTDTTPQSQEILISRGYSIDLKGIILPFREVEMSHHGSGLLRMKLAK